MPYFTATEANVFQIAVQALPREEGSSG